MRNLIIFVCILLFIIVVGLVESPSKSAPTEETHAVEALPPDNPAQAAKCRKILNGGPIPWKITHARDGYESVVVGRNFDAAPFDAKQWFDATVRCVLSNGRADSAGIKYVGYLDAYTNKEVAKWSEVTGFSVD